VVSREADQQISLSQKEIFAADHQRARSFADKGRKGRLNLARTTCCQNQKIRIKDACRILGAPVRVTLRVTIGGVLASAQAGKTRQRGC
jgi:hypothetical protein